MAVDITAQMRAERSAAAMLAADAATRALGMELTRIAPGTARFSMRVRDDMLNGHGICHGGYLFTLADSAFAFACNSYNLRTVAQQNQITYLHPAQGGELLIADAREVSRHRRTGIYDVTVETENGDVRALMRGLCRSIGGQHFPEDTGAEA